MSTATIERPAAAAVSTATAALREYLAFKLGAEEYGIDILRVQEIRSYEEPTRLANAPQFIKGVVNLRGLVVPVVDLRLKFGLIDPKYDQFTVVIVLSLAKRVVGIVVDSVSDVMALSPEQLRAVPEFSGAVDTEHLEAIAALDERMLILIDIEKLMASPDMALVDATH